MQIPTVIYPQYKIQQTVNNKRIFFCIEGDVTSSDKQVIKTRINTR